MNTAARLSAYGAVLALIAGGAWAAGSAVGPLSVQAASSGHGGTSGAEGAGHGDDHSGTVAEAAPNDLPSGLASSMGGYTLTPTDTTLAVGANTFSFRIAGPDGAAVTAFDVEHDKQMHLIVIRRDTAGFQHLHPELAADGTWTAPLTVAEAGSYRVFADFKPTGGAATTLGTDVNVAGQFQPHTYSPSRIAEVDGYQVRLDGDLVAGNASPVRFIVSKDGEPVTDLQPYLAAYGHLVALRQGDLAYLHVHPDGSPGDGKTQAGPEIAFVAEVPTAGRYRLFLDFQHNGVVRTAEFTVDTAGSAAQPATVPTEVQPTEVQPTEVQPTEVQPEGQPTETQPTETQPTETQPAETQPAEDAHPTEEGHGHGG
jgi:cell division septation protein DedD